MGHRLRRTLGTWDARNQAAMERHNEVAGGTWEEFARRTSPGPTWAYAISALPLIGWIGTVAIVRAHRKRRKGAS